jgi:hypothetical protein
MTASSDRNVVCSWSVWIRDAVGTADRRPPVVGVHVGEATGEATVVVYDWRVRPWNKGVFDN